MSEGEAARQTLSFLKRRLGEAGIRPQTQYGQNFLIDLNLLGLLLDAADLGPDDVVLEVGTGMGSLTAMLARRVAHVVTVEIDAQMYQLASEELIDCANLTMLRTDALKNKNRLRPEVLAAVDAQLAAAPGRRLKLVANLPYNIATPLLSNLLALDRPPQRMVVTIQREVAERIVARPGTKDYGALSVWIQSQCRAQILRTLPATAFWPRPKVESAFVEIVPEADRRDRIADRQFFHTFVRAMFFHRRKILRTELLSAAGRRFDKPQIDDLLARLGLPGTIRAEELDVDTMLRLCEAVRLAGSP